MNLIQQHKTEEQLSNKLLTNNVYAYKTHSELDLINIYLKKQKYINKKQNYSKNSYKQRLWWKQHLIQFDKPNWWDSITGWERVGLYRIFLAKGSFFFRRKYRIKAFNFKQLWNNTNLLFNKNYLIKKQYLIKIKKQWFIPKNNKIKTILFNINLSKTILISNSIWNKQILHNFNFSLFQLNNKLYNYNFNILTQQLNKQQKFTNYLKNSNQLIINESISESVNSFKLNCTSLIFLKYIKKSWLRDNSYYINVIDFRLILLHQPYYKITVGLLSSFYGQQLSLLSSRRTQRWFIRDTKRFNYWIYNLTEQTTIKLLDLTSFKSIHFNVKGRVADTRRVFSKQHNYSQQPISKSKYSKNFLQVPTYSQKTLTTKWGSTNLRVVYFLNPHYYNNKVKELNLIKKNKRLLWQLNTNNSKLDLYNNINLNSLNKFLNYLGNYTDLEPFYQQTTTKSKLGLISNYKIKYSSLTQYKTFSNINQSNFKTLSKIKNNFIRLKDINKFQRLFINNKLNFKYEITPFLPKQGNTYRLWSKYVLHKFFKKIRHQSKKRFSLLKKKPYYKYNPNKQLSLFKHKNYFIYKLIYQLSGVNLINLNYILYNYK